MTDSKTSREWVRLRGLVRRQLLVGDVSFSDNGFDSPRSHLGKGLDTEARCELVSVLMALRLIKEKDWVAHALLVRDIGRPCAYKVHSAEPGHCHPRPRREIPLVADLEWEEVNQRTEWAARWLVRLVIDSSTME